jgi:GH15 family glucan-1,4-alpha-glucosidase
MAWVAFDRAWRADNHYSRRLRNRWKQIADEIHADICEKGVHPTRGHFVQHYGSERVDASLLLLPLTGFVPPDDPRVAATVAQVERELLHDGLVLRYGTDSGVDGLPEGEGAFLACSFWLVDNYILLGRKDEARAMFERLLTLCNDVGLLAEEYDPRGRRMLGNFPQAFSHVALANSAFALMGEAEMHFPRRCE